LKPFLRCPHPNFLHLQRVSKIRYNPLTKQHTSEVANQEHQMITAIELENFKGIGKRVKIDLAPITLIFGANSAGKSSVIHALHYFREVLETGNGNIDEIDATDGDLRLGGFENVIHRHDVSRSIMLRVDLSNWLHEDFLRPIHDLRRWSSINFEEPMLKRVISIGVELEVGARKCDKFWTKRSPEDLPGEYRPRYDSPTVRRTKIFVNEVLFFELEATDKDWDDEIGNVCFLNFEHPALSKLEDQAVLKLIGATAQYKGDCFDEENTENRFDLGPSLGALPIHFGGIERPDVEPSDIDYSQQISRWILKRYLHSFAMGAIDRMKKVLKESPHLGPVREVPPRNLRTSQRSNQRSWYRGRAAWMYLLDLNPTGTPMMLKRGNRTVRSSDPWQNWSLDLKSLIDAPYKIERQGIWTSAEDVFWNGDSASAKQRNLELMLTDLRSPIPVEVSFEDVGVGISQVVPVIVAAQNQHLPFVYIEQPELHLHPKQQANLGDVFASCIESSREGNGRVLMIETHSELLILRLLRLVRETNRGVVNDKGIKLTPRQLKVYYVSSDEEGTVFKEIQISDTGKFIQPWPDDFFELDFQERFA